MARIENRWQKERQMVANSNSAISEWLDAKFSKPRFEAINAERINILGWMI